MVKTIKRGLVIVCISAFAAAQAQTCGFGCLGLAGVSGGYGVQLFSGDLNNYIHDINSGYSSQKSLDEFKYAQGYYGGIRLINIIDDANMISVKAYVSVLKSKSDGAGFTANGVTVASSKTMDLSFTNYGIGVDYSYSLSESFALKILDLSVSFNSAKLDIKTIPVDINDGSYKSTLKMGYSAGAGIIIFLYKKVLSLEATAGYKYFSISSLENDNGVTLKKSIVSQETMADPVKNGGLEISAQLILGMPF